MTPEEIAYQARTYPHRDIEGMINELINEKLCAAERSVGKKYQEWYVRNDRDFNYDIGNIRQTILDQCIPIEKDGNS